MTLDRTVRLAARSAPRRAPPATCFPVFTLNAALGSLQHWLESGIPRPARRVERVPAVPGHASNEAGTGPRWQRHPAGYSCRLLGCRWRATTAKPA
ncbi:MAG: hypothetical protein IPG06_13535 [Haliea sp.]|nr:hypothetical protein [Haliea sp.]